MSIPEEIAYNAIKAAPKPPNLPNQQESLNEPPRPLRKKAPPAEPFPIGALGGILGNAALAIHDKIQAPLAICAQSVLAAATLAVQPRRDVMLPIGQKRPLGNYWLSIAGSGERKTSADNEAIAPVEAREAELQAQYDVDCGAWKNKQDAWDQKRRNILINKKDHKTPESMSAALNALGPAPAAPLMPMMVCPEPTYEGLCRLYMHGLPSVGLFSSEGGQFIGGHGMSEDNKLKTCTAICGLWDGKPIKRVRAGDGAIMLRGRRLSMHLMVQPGVASTLLSDAVLLDQGLLSRFLITAPETTAGTRFHKELKPETALHLQCYHQRMLDILRKPMPLAEGKNNELEPTLISLSPSAAKAFYGFSDQVEGMIKPGGSMEPIISLANKLPEHAVRLAAVIALVEDLEATEINPLHLSAGISLAEYYAGEAMRMLGEAFIPPDMKLAERLLAWLHHSWKQDVVSLPDIYQRSLNAIGDKKTAKRMVGILEDHGWLVEIPGGLMIEGVKRNEAWRVVHE